MWDKSVAGIAEGEDRQCLGGRGEGAPQNGGTGRRFRPRSGFRDKGLSAGGPGG